ncbi:monocarboxylate transporter 12-like [Glandiceps talaboti]
MSDVSANDTDPPDGGWGWFVVLATFVVTALGTGSFYAFGVLYVAFLDAFGESKAATSLAGTISAFGIVMMGSVGLASSGHFGHRKTVMAAGMITSAGLFATSFTTSLYQVYFTYGIAGCGIGMAVIPSVEMIGVYFKRRLPLAIGLAMAGSGAGQFTLSVVSQILIDKYGWRGTLMILSAMSANMCVAGALLRPLTFEHSKPLEYKTLPVNENQSIENDTKEDIRNGSETYMTNHVNDNNCLETFARTKLEKRKPRSKLGCIGGLKSFLGSLYDVSLFKEPIMYLVIVTGCCQSVGHNIVIIQIVKRAREFGISSTLSSFVPAVMGLSQLTGRPFWGAMGNSPKVKSYVIYALAMVICGVSSIISIYTKSFAGQLVYIILFGIGLGGYIILIPVVIAHFLGAKRMGYGMTYVWQVHGIVGLFIAPLSGWMRDTSGIYDGVFWLAGVSLVMGAIVALLLPLVNKLVQRKRQTSDIMDKRVSYHRGPEHLLVEEFMTTL